MFQALEEVPERAVKLGDTQKEIVEHEKGPLWVIAGPGSGKTETLVLRCLKLLLVDGINPKSIMITTFTEKAGRNLQDRLTTYKYHIAKKYPKVAQVDLFQLRVGTLHSLCNSIMIEYRYPAYRDYTPLDDLEQLLFTYFHSDLAKPPRQFSHEDEEFWNYFSYIWAADWKGEMYLKKGWTPSRWMRARAAQLIFNRIVEDLLDLQMMESRRGVWKTLAEGYKQYRKSLEDNYRVDFAHMQERFLKFLDTPLGKRFLEGSDELTNPGLSHVLVDEYQDTNPIQEAIYLKLANREPHNICVVGDDDQALYRFRGGTVECMVNFHKACKREWGIEVKPTHMVENYRSHPKIVTWINHYVDSFATMKRPGVRAKGKPPLLWKSSIDGKWPAVGLISATAKSELADRFAETVKGMLQTGIIAEPSDCVLLMRSTRETRRWAGPFADALREKGVPVYNPRSRSYLEQEEIQIALGALLEVLDPDRSYSAMYVPPRVAQKCDEWRNAYLLASRKYGQLADYVRRAKREIESLGEEQTIPSSLEEVLYHILNHDPFVEWLEVPDRTVRLGQLTRLLEAFSSTPVPGYPGVSRGFLRMSRDERGRISWKWRQMLYHSFISLIQEEGLNDPEDEEVLLPRDIFPIMTVHQAKGLEFPFVFVGGLDEQSYPDAQHEIEEDFSKFRRNPLELAPKEERAKEDMIRFYYVAYSRARYALILLTLQDKMTPGEVSGCYLSLGGKDVNWLKQHVNFLPSM